MLYQFFDATVESLFEPLGVAVERSASWRFSQISHWVPAQFYALQGDITAATSARERQRAIISFDQREKLHLQAVRRHSANLCNIISEDYAAIISDFLTSGTSRLNDSAYELLIDVAAAHAFSSNIEACENMLGQAKRLRIALPAFEVQGIHNSMVVEVITMCAIGRWSQAKRLREQYRGNVPGSPLLEPALGLFCQGPPFVRVQSILEPCFGKPFVGLSALLMKRVIERELVQHSNPLTAAEKDVLRLLGLGRSNKEIASTRERSGETVRLQLTSLYRKLGVENRTSAVAVARERGLL